ncbi:hypothetical protein QN239_31485 [Mycolicibacterium sp. Y3]
MRYIPAAALTLLAATLAALGGALQSADGPGTLPGIALTRVAAAVVIGAVAVAVITRLTRDPGQATAKYAYVTATDGHIVIPVVGPYENEKAAYGDLASVRAQFDPEGGYAWTVQTTTDADAVVDGVGNEHFKLV